MADLVSYNMGQIRWQNNLNLYREDLDFKAYNIETVSLGDKKYLDLVFHPNSLITFSQDESYYLKLDIPRNLSFDMTFDLKMLEASMINNNPESFSISDRNQYQEIKRFVVARQVSSISEYSRVILYPSGGNEDGTPVVTIAKEFSNANNGDVYYDSNTKKYFIKKPNNENIEIGYKNDVLLNHTWKADKQTENKASVEFVFSNKVAGKSFNCLLLELNRNSNDDDISHEINGNKYSGLYVDPSKITVTCYRLKNMIDIAKNENNTTIKAFNNIGVWSHPDAIMAINGEEIRVGQSGYYELNDFDITNFGMVIRDSTDKFSLDYQYKVSNTTS